MDLPQGQTTCTSKVHFYIRRADAFEEKWVLGVERVEEEQEGGGLCHGLGGEGQGDVGLPVNGSCGG